MGVGALGIPRPIRFSSSPDVVYGIGRGLPNGRWRILVAVIPRGESGNQGQAIQSRRIMQVSSLY